MTNRQFAVIVGMLGVIAVMLGSLVFRKPPLPPGTTSIEQAPPRTLAAAGKSPAESRDRAERSLAQAAIDSSGPIGTAIKLFRMHVGRYPTDLKELVNKPGTEAEANKWNGPYLENATRLKDPWAEEYQYKSPGQHHQNTYDLWSKGPDRQDGTKDDIANFKPQQSQ